MARKRSAKPEAEPFLHDTVKVATGTAATPSPPTTRKKTIVAVAEEKKHRIKAAKHESPVSELVGPDINNTGGTGSIGGTDGAKRSADNLNKVRKAVDEISDTFGSALASPSSSPSWPLPGALAPSVNTRSAMYVVVPASIASAALVSVWYLLAEHFATLSSQTWTAQPPYLGVTAMSAIWSPPVAVALRILKLTLAWDSLSNLAALNVLSHGPIIYLLSSFYKVPLRVAIANEGISFLADAIPLLVWRWWWDGTEEDYGQADVVQDSDEVISLSEEDNEGQVLARAARDPATVIYSSVFSSALYGFTFVQACRLFLPATFVVHFFGIATVEPARPYIFDRWSALALHDVFRVLFQSTSMFALSLACGTAAGDFLRGDGFRFRRDAALNKKASVLRTIVLSLVVGMDIFARCLLGIQGIDAVGAVAFASVSSAAVILVGAGLMFTELWS